jgi:4-aminobutyrate aminotransferase-like enzyme
MGKMMREHKILGDVRGKGCLLAIELVKDRDTKEPFEEAGNIAYQKAFAKGLAWVPAGHILRLSPPIIMEDNMLMKGFDIIDEALFETERYFSMV